MGSDTKFPKLDSYSMLLVNNNRSKAYLQNLILFGYKPQQVIVLQKDEDLLPENKRYGQNGAGTSQGKRECFCPEAGVRFDEAETILQTLETHHIDYRIIPTLDINSDEVVRVVGESPTRYMVYSGPGGSLLQEPLLSAGKFFLHVHPGWLPDYCGSTTIYYSLLAEKSAACSVIMFTSEIDRGPVFLRRRFKWNETKELDHVFDPSIRTATLIDFFKKTYSQSPQEIITPANEEESVFYIIHPVLKHLAILKGGDR